MHAVAYKRTLSPAPAERRTPVSELAEEREPRAERSRTRSEGAEVGGPGAKRLYQRRRGVAVKSR